MADLIALDSGDHYDSDTSYMKWTGSVTSYPGHGRTGDRAFGAGTKVFNLESTITVGIACNLPNITLLPLRLANGASGIRAEVGFYEDTRPYVQVSPRYPAVGYTKSESGNITNVRANWWFYLEFQVTHICYEDGGFIYDSFDYIVRINEEIVLSGNITTKLGWPYSAVESGFTSLTTIWSGGSPNYYDDLIITNGEFLGDVRIWVIYPNGDGDVNDWTPLTGPDNYTEVDEHPPDGLTSYVSSNAVDQIDMYELEDITIFGEIKGIQVNTVAQKDDAGSCTFRQHSKVSDTVYENDADIYPSYGNWFDHLCPHRKNPITGLDFTEEEINAMQVGIRRVEPE